jgi:DNA-binding NtrC family response regulator
MEAMPMPNDARRPQVLIEAEVRSIDQIVQEILEEEGYHVTRVRSAGDAFAVARSVLHPLLVIVDQYLPALPEFLTLFAVHADELAPCAWVALRWWQDSDMPAAALAFYAARSAEQEWLPFEVEDLLAAVEHAGERLLGPRSRQAATLIGLWRPRRAPLPGSMPDADE